MTQSKAARKRDGTAKPRHAPSYATVRIPAEVLRRIKATAALRGMSIIDLIAEMAEFWFSKNGEASAA